MKNPKWQRDELILTLDLYFELNAKGIDNGNPKITQLSELLNNLPIHNFDDKSPSFRNVSGVTLKLSNFLAIDPGHPGKGMDRYSKLDQEVFTEFTNNRPLLKKLSDNIKNTLKKEGLVTELKYSTNEDEDDYNAPEGKVLLKLHRYRERNSSLVKKKKMLHLLKHGTLACELCSFDFEKIYGPIGKGFIECHHRTPLSELTPDTKTTLKDLMLICSNCHRMVHRGWKNK